MSFKSLLPVAGIVVALGTPQTAARAQFNFTVTRNSKGMSGAARVVEMAGKYQVANSWRLVRVQITAVDVNGRLTSSAAGRFDSSRGTWSAGVGDFRLAFYYLEFTVSTPSGNRVYVTPRYRW